MFTSDETWDPNRVSSGLASVGQNPAQPGETSDSSSEVTYLTCKDTPPMMWKSFETHAIRQKTLKPGRNALNPGKFRPHLGWIGLERVKRTLDHTKQLGRSRDVVNMKHHFKTAHPALCVNRLDDKVATDTIFSDTPAHDDGIPGHGGCTMAQLFVGAESRVKYIAQ